MSGIGKKEAVPVGGLMEAYISDDYRYDPAWDTSEVRLTVAIHGESYTASVMDWYEIMCGGTRSVTGCIKLYFDPSLNVICRN